MWSFSGDFFFFFWFFKFNILFTKKKNSSIYIHLGSNAAKILFFFFLTLQNCISFWIQLWYEAVLPWLVTLGRNNLEEIQWSVQILVYLQN